MRAAIWPGVRRVPFTGSTTTVTAFWPAALASAATSPPRASALRASSSRGLPTPSRVRRAMLPAWPNSVSDWPLAPVKRLASIARTIVPLMSLSMACALARSCLSAATKTARLPEKALGKAENSTFIRFPRSWRALNGDFSRLRRDGASSELPPNGCKFGWRPVAADSISTGPQDGHGNDFSPSAPHLGDRSRQARRTARRSARQPRLYRDRPRREQDSCRRTECRQDADRRAATQRADRRQQAAPVGHYGQRRGYPEERRKLRDRADAVGQHRLLLQSLRAAGHGVDRQGAAPQERLPHGGHHQHGDARHHRRRDQDRPRNGVGPQGRARSRLVLQSGVHRAGQ